MIHTPRRAGRHPENSTAAGSEYMEPTADSCRGLWASVLLRAIADAYTAPRDLNLRDDMTANARTNAISSDKGARAMHARAKSYIGSKDFRLVCWLAGHDPEFVMEALRDRPDAIASGKRGRAA